METTDLVEKKPSRFARWYSFNKQRIPFLLMILSVLFFTATIDFNMTSTIRLDSHIKSMDGLQAKYAIVSFYLFLIYLISIVQVANAISFSKHRSLMSFILFSALTIAQIVLVILFSQGSLFGRLNPVIPSYTWFSVIVFWIGTLIMIAANVFEIFYVKWTFKKDEEE